MFAPSAQPLPVSLFSPNTHSDDDDDDDEGGEGGNVFLAMEVDEGGRKGVVSVY